MEEYTPAFQAESLEMSRYLSVPLLVFISRLLFLLVVSDVSVSRVDQSIQIGILPIIAALRLTRDTAFRLTVVLNSPLLDACLVNI